MGLVPPHHFIDEDTEKRSPWRRSDSKWAVMEGELAPLCPEQESGQQGPMGGRSLLENDPEMFFFCILGLLSVVRLGLKTPDAWERGHEPILGLIQGLGTKRCHSHL